MRAAERCEGDRGGVGVKVLITRSPEYMGSRGMSLCGRRLVMVVIEQYMGILYCMSICFVALFSYLLIVYI